MLFSIATVQSGDNDVPGVNAFIKAGSLQAVAVDCVDQRSQQAQSKEGDHCADAQTNQKDGDRGDDVDMRQAAADMAEWLRRGTAADRLKSAGLGATMPMDLPLVKHDRPVRLGNACFRHESSFRSAHESRA